MVVFILELPWDLGVPDDYEVVAGGEEWLRFRTVEVRTQLPLAASDLAFGRLEQDGELPRKERRRRERKRREMTETPFTRHRTVAAVYVSSEDDPPRFEAEPLSRAFGTALDKLNDWLISLGILRDDRLRPIGIGDLPEAIPVMPAAMIDGEPRHGSGQMFELRDLSLDKRELEPDDLEQAERMLEIIASKEGLASFFELVQRAGSARRADRHREAVIDYATAGELFITTMLDQVGVRRAVSAEKLTNFREGPFKDRAQKLCRLLNVPAEPGDPDSPIFYWWMHCYEQRHGIVHRGTDSIGMLSEAARIGTVTMVVDIREAIRGDAALADLGSMILWGRRVDETGEGHDSMPDLPPRSR